MIRPLVKICGLTRASDAAFCARAGADWLGFIFHPESPRRAEPERVADFDTGRARRVGVFVNQTADEVLRIMTVARLDMAQLHGQQNADFCRAIGPERVIKTLWPQGENFERQQDELAGFVTYFLYDAGKSGGGHGQAFDPKLIARPSPRPWLLAGGLTAGRVVSLVNSGLPHNWLGFDLNSGVESAPGLKDTSLVASAINAIRDTKD